MATFKTKILIRENGNDIYRSILQTSQKTLNLIKNAYVAYLNYDY